MDELVQRAEDIKNIQQSNDDYSPCPSCKIVGAASTKHVCATCGTTGCDLCMTYNPMEDKYYCEECWNKQEQQS